MSEKMNIYPPSIFDPLLDGKKPSKPRRALKRPGPDSEGVAKDAYLGHLAADVAAQGADSPEPEDGPGAGSMEPPKGKPQRSGS